MKSLKLLVAATALGALSLPAMAYESGDWIIRGGLVTVQPNDSSSTINLNYAPLAGNKVAVNGDTQLGLTISYMAADHVGVELLLATPFKHDVSGRGPVLNSLGLGNIAEVKQLPPTLTVNYHFMDAGNAFQPYVGVGVNYTHFFATTVSTTYEGSFGPSHISLDDSVGLAARAGFDYLLTKDLGVNVGVWYADINTKATISSPLSRVTTDVTIDPWVYMAGISYRF